MPLWIVGGTICGNSEDTEPISVVVKHDVTLVINMSIILDGEKSECQSLEMKEYLNPKEYLKPKVGAFFK